MAAVALTNVFNALHVTGWNQGVGEVRDGRLLGKVLHV